MTSSPILEHFAEYMVDGKINNISEEKLMQLISNALVKNPSKKQTGKTEKVVKPSKKKSKYDAEEIPEAVEGFSRPYIQSYLAGYYLEDGVKLQYKDFAEACKKCLESEGCGGITKTSRGYSLRKVGQLKENPARDFKSGLASWVKTDPSFEEDQVCDCGSLVGHFRRDCFTEEKPSKKKEVKPEVVKPSKKKVVKEEPEFLEDTEESEVEEDDVDVEEISINGKPYYYEEATNKIYDPSTSEVVGSKNEYGEYTLDITEL